MIFEDLEIIWRDKASQPSENLDDEALRGVVAEKARTYRRNILWHDISDIGTHLVVVGFLIYVCLSALPDGRWFTWKAAPLILTAIAYTFVSLFRLVSRQGQKRREVQFDDTIRGNLQKLRANVVHQIWLQGNYVWWYILPILPGYALLVSSHWDDGPLEFWGMGITIVLIFAFIYWGNRHSLRTGLMPKKQELEAMLAAIENGEQIPEIREAFAKGESGPMKKAISGLIVVAVFYLVGWFLFTVLSPIPKPQVPEFENVSGFGEGDTAQIDAWLRETVERSEFPSLSVAIVRDGKVVYQRAFGYENTWSERPATTNTAYHVASVTKAFTASLAGLLHERGVIDLDQPVLRYLPPGVSISNTPEVGATITLRQLASHTSGLQRGVPGTVQTVTGRYALEPQRLYDLLPGVTLEFQPGTEDRYSNLGFGLLGHALELAAGKPLDKLLDEILAEPLQLRHTAIHVNETLPVATGYSTAPRLPEGQSYRQRLAGSGGLVTSTGDLARFLAAQMKPGLFSSNLLAQLHAAMPLKDGSMTSRALGWRIETGVSAGRILSKNGGRNNCGAWIGFAPDHGVGVAVITNTGAPAVDEIGRWLLERSVPGGNRIHFGNSYAKVAPYTGVRWDPSADEPTVRVRDEWLRLTAIDGIPIDRLMKTARDEFGDIARKRFAEDLVELLHAAGHEPDWTVTLMLDRGDGKGPVPFEERMTEEKRSAARAFGK